MYKVRVLNMTISYAHLDIFCSFYDVFITAGLFYTHFLFCIFMSLVSPLIVMNRFHQ